MRTTIVLCCVLIVTCFGQLDSNCSNLSDLYTVCLDNVTNITLQYDDLQTRYTVCGCGVDPCVLEVPLNYSVDLHIAAVFIILVSSTLGVVFPIAAKHSKKLGIHPFCVILGKCAGTGVILAVSLIHMLLPANDSLTSPCAPAAFNTDYGAYAFLFSMIAAILMHFLDFIMSQYFASRQMALNASRSAASDVNDSSSQRSLSESSSNSHSHGSLLELQGQDWTGKKIAEAYMIEFGVTVHSIFIGIALGVVGYDGLVPLLIALVFHQFFEGVALGARIVDANFSHLNELIFAAIFSFAAPIGISVGIGVYTSLNTNSQGYLLVQGTFDAVSAGILLYTGFMLLLLDFPRDMLHHCSGKYKRLMQFGMFASLWIAAGLMAFLGKYL